MTDDQTCKKKKKNRHRQTYRHNRVDNQPLRDSCWLIMIEMKHYENQQHKNYAIIIIIIIRAVQ